MAEEASRVLFVGQCYYNFWYLSRELRKRGLTADVLDTDVDDQNQPFYHGSDFRFRYRSTVDLLKQLAFYVSCFWRYDIFHFANAEGLHFGLFIHRLLSFLGPGADVRLLKLAGKRIAYTNNGCRDGVLQSTFAKWGPTSVCAICRWQNVPSVCSDDKNRVWGELRNSLADYQCTLGGNRVDFNTSDRVHEVPWVYCLDKDFWTPDILVPSNYLLPIPAGTVKIYHAVGNYASRTQATSRRNIKSTDVYLDAIDRLKAEGHSIEMIFFNDVPNRQLRYYQAQADIVVDMLTFGFFGANVREALMLGKPVICFLRPEWLETMRYEIPDYVAQLPVISATPDTVFEELRRLVVDESYRLEVGRRSRAFAEKWHASDVAAEKFESIYRSLRSEEFVPMQFRS